MSNGESTHSAGGFDGASWPIVVAPPALPGTATTTAAARHGTSENRRTSPLPEPIEATLLPLGVPVKFLESPRSPATSPTQYPAPRGIHPLTALGGRQALSPARKRARR